MIMHELPPSSAVVAEPALHARYQVDDYSYRHSYPHSASMNGKRTATASIPIDRQSMRKSASEYRMAQEEAEADYKDFVFFSRVVDGISKQNSLLKDGSYLKSTNETLLNNIVKARHEFEEKEVEEDVGIHNHYYYPTGLQIHHNMKVVTPVRDDCMHNITQCSEAFEVDDHHGDYEDEGVFDLEL